MRSGVSSAVARLGITFVALVRSAPCLSLMHSPSLSFPATSSRHGRWRCLWRA